MKPSAVLYNLAWLEVRRIRLTEGHSTRYRNLASEALDLRRPDPQLSPDVDTNAQFEELHAWEHFYGEHL